MTKAGDLETLGLAAGTSDPGKIKKAYHLLALKMHPDKPGGDKVAFQKLVAAFERLQADKYPPLSSSSSHAKNGGSSFGTGRRGFQFDAGFGSYDDFRDYYDDCDYDHDDEYDDYDDFCYGGGAEDNFWENLFGWHFNFFGSSATHGYDDFFYQYEQSAEERAKARAENVKNYRDYRDKKSRGAGASCTTCGQRDSITKQDAKSNGLEWTRYSKHPEGFRTCWACKNAHDSVATEKQAMTKFKVLTHEVFRRLDKEGRSFCHQPVTAYVARNSRYYWIKDLEREATERGWKGYRGKRKGNNSKGGASAPAGAGSNAEPQRKKQRREENAI